MVLSYDDYGYQRPTVVDRDWEGEKEARQKGQRWLNGYARSIAEHFLQNNPKDGPYYWPREVEYLEETLRKYVVDGVYKPTLQDKCRWIDHRLRNDFECETYTWDECVTMVRVVSGNELSLDASRSLLEAIGMRKYLNFIA
jgi:hypothetical protein